MTRAQDREARRLGQAIRRDLLLRDLQPVRPRLLVEGPLGDRRVVRDLGEMGLEDPLALGKHLVAQGEAVLEVRRDPDRMRKLLEDSKRPIQFIFAGKAHPADNEG